MADLDRLLAAFEAGHLRRPDAAQPNVIDLVRAIGALTGVPDLELSANAEEICDQIGSATHVVLVLADGLGTHALAHLPPDSWLRTHVAAELQSVFPSTTAAAITSTATAVWPAEHGIVGWWTYLSQLRETACVLPFIRHRDGEPLLDCGVAPKDVFLSRPMISRMSRSAAVAQPTSIIDSAYSTWFGDGADTLPYRGHRDAVAQIAGRITDAAEPTFTYWYTSVIDREAHEHGANSREARAAVIELDERLEELAEALAGLDARIVLTADHGHLDAAARFPIEADDPLCAFLRTPPSGDLRVGFYHLQDGARQPFTHEFQNRFGEHFVLITTQQLEDLRLLGPDPLAPETRRRVGDFTSLALDASVLRYIGGSDGDHVMHQRSHHSGLSPDEMTVPLVIG